MGVPLRQLYGQTEAAGAYTLQMDHGIDCDSSGVPFDDTEIEVAGSRRRVASARSRCAIRGCSRAISATMPQRSATLTAMAGCGQAMRASWTTRPAHRHRSSEGHRQHRERVTVQPAIHREQAEILAFRRRMRRAGQGRPYLAAIVCIRHSMVAKWAERRSIGFTTYQSLAADPEVQALLAGELETGQRIAAGAQRIAASAPLQGARPRRRRAYAYAQGAPRGDRRALPPLIEAIYAGQRQRAHRERGHVRGRPPRSARRGTVDPGRRQQVAACGLTCALRQVALGGECRMLRSSWPSTASHYGSEVALALGNLAAAEQCSMEIASIVKDLKIPLVLFPYHLLCGEIAERMHRWEEAKTHYMALAARPNRSSRGSPARWARRPRARAARSWDRPSARCRFPPGSWQCPCSGG